MLSAALVVKTPYSAPTGVTLSSSTLALTTGGNRTLTATIAPSTAQQQVNWKTGDAATATVDTNGKVIAVKAGTVTITAESKTDTSKKATCTVTITDPAGGG
ncbi:Ig-like domain-containing protein [Paenibacillus sp. Sa2BVA9]|uniref:Ig-like domain-containing protein n=1 Tax=Paenibacillus gallinarum TaxID=2762232 RepID=A0ABR8SW96_9BACL|nr:Ig-like domain-containing protein [Paenibacillus gallinarum]